MALSAAEKAALAELAAEVEVASTWVSGPHRAKLKSISERLTKASEGEKLPDVVGD